MKVSLPFGEWGGLDQSIAEARRSFADLSPEALESCWTKPSHPLARPMPPPEGFEASQRLCVRTRRRGCAEGYRGYSIALQVCALRSRTRSGQPPRALQNISPSASLPAPLQPWVWTTR